MLIQGYLEIDHQSMTDDEFEIFNTMMNQYMVQYYLIAGGTREYYMCLLRDDSNIAELLELMADRNPVINGMWNLEATPYGQTKTVTVAEDGAVTIDISGDPTYSFDLALHLSHTPALDTIDEDGNTTTTEVTTFTAIHQFSGWAKPEEY